MTEPLSDFAKIGKIARDFIQSLTPQPEPSPPIPEQPSPAAPQPDPFSGVNRVVVVVPGQDVIERWNVVVAHSIQDGGRTLKLFVSDRYQADVPLQENAKAPGGDDVRPEFSPPTFYIASSSSPLPPYECSTCGALVNRNPDAPGSRYVHTRWHRENDR